MALFHLPGLFEFNDFYSAFLPLYAGHREWFLDFCEIASVYGAPEGCIWGGGRTGSGRADPEKVLRLFNGYGISARLTFSNSLLRKEHLSDKDCNRLCRLFADTGFFMEHGTCDIPADALNNMTDGDIPELQKKRNGVIVHSELLTDYLRENYPDLYLVSSTTKVITDFDGFIREAEREEFDYIVPDFRLNKEYERLSGLPAGIKDKVEFLCNECCFFGCADRKACYENVSAKNLGADCVAHVCRAPGGSRGYRFSEAMRNPGFIGIGDIRDIYLPMGFSNFKIEGRELGSALVLEFILHYLTKPEYALNVREEIYLDSMLDLF